MVYNITGPVTMGTTATNTIINGGVITVNGSTSYLNTSPTIGLTASTSVTLTTPTVTFATTTSTNFASGSTNIITNFVTTAIGDLITTTGGSATTLGRIAAAAAGLVLTSNGVGTLSTYQAITTAAGSAASFCYLTANQSITNTTATTLAGFTTTAPYYVDSTFTAATGIFLTATTGKYFVSIDVTWDNSGSNNGVRSVTIFYNNTTVIAASSMQPGGDTATPEIYKRPSDI